MTTKRKGWFIPPTKGLLEPVESPTPHPAREAMGLLWHIPEQEQYILYVHQQEERSMS